MSEQLVEALQLPGSPSKIFKYLPLRGGGCFTQEVYSPAESFTWLLQVWKSNPIQPPSRGSSSFIHLNVLSPGNRAHCFALMSSLYVLSFMPMLSLSNPAVTAATVSTDSHLSSQCHLLTHKKKIKKKQHATSTNELAQKYEYKQSVCWGKIFFFFFFSRADTAQLDAMHQLLFTRLHLFFSRGRHLAKSCGTCRVSCTTG